MTTLIRTRTVQQRKQGNGFWTRLFSVDALWRQRQALADMPHDRLDDIGITRAQAMTEAAKPLWNVPRHWLK